MGRIFSRKILEESRPWLAWGLLLAGPSVFAFSVAYALSLILALSSGMGVLEATALFHTAISPVLEPLIAVAAGSWLLFWYLYLLAVPRPRHSTTDERCPYAVTILPRLAWPLLDRTLRDCSTNSLVSVPGKEIPCSSHSSCPFSSNCTDTSRQDGLPGPIL